MANLGPLPAFAAATPAMSAGGVLADEVGAAMLRVVAPVVVEVLDAKALANADAGAAPSPAG